MRHIRTVTVAITPLLCDIITEVVAEQAPIDIIARLDRSDEIAPRLQTLAPALVLMGLCRDEDDGLASSMRDVLPRARMIALSRDVRRAYLHAPHRDRAVLIDVSPGALIEAIRGF